jgi:hypothetical protein
VRDAVLRHFGSQPGIGYDFSCADGYAGLVLIGPGVVHMKVMEAQQQMKLPHMTIRMPCGKSVTYHSESDMPSESEGCDCGDPKHWYVYRVHI